jgi:hypothetical protein
LIYWPSKGPLEAEDFEFDFTPALETSETISSKTVTATGVTVASSAIVDVGDETDAGVQINLSGGVLGTPGVVVCTVTTSGGRTYSETAIVLIGEEPVSLAEAKAQVRMVDDDSEDVFIASLLMPARATIERMSRYFFIPASRTETFGSWGGEHLQPTYIRHSCKQFLEIYRRPILSVDSVTYGPDDTDYTGFVAPVGRFPLRIYPAADNSFPHLETGNVITVSYTSGSLDPASQEYLIGKRAMLLLIGHWFENRESVIADTRAVAIEVPQTVQWLLDELGPVPAY